jgi:hypothetical protein
MIFITYFPPIGDCRLDSSVGIAPFQIALLMAVRKPLRIT